MTSHKKSNMADSRHFDNRYISISQPRVVRIWRNLVCRCKFSPMRRNGDKNSEIRKFKMLDGRHIENHFWAITRLHNVRSRWNLERGGINARVGRLGDENVHFVNPTWRSAAILKKVIYPYLSRESSEFDEIWYADANFHPGDEKVTKVKKFANSRWQMDAILKIIFGYNSAP